MIQKVLALITGIILIAALAVTVHASQGMGPGPGVKAYSAGGGGSSYFGFCGEDNSSCSSAPSASPTYDGWEAEDSGYIVADITGVTCPGSGTRTIASIKGFMKSTSGSGSDTVYFGLYTTNLVTAQCYGSVSVTSGTAGWVGQLAANLSGTCTCEGGTAYYFLFGPSGNDVAFARSTGYSSGTSAYVSSMPSNIGYDLSSILGNFTPDTNWYLWYIEVE